MSKWTKKDIQLLKRSFPNNCNAAIADGLERPLQAVKKKASRLGLKKSRRYLRMLGWRV